MFTSNPDFQRGAKRGGTAQFGGKDRAILLSAVARGRGLKFSPKFGLVDPQQGDKVLADTWDKIAPLLLSLIHISEPTRRRGISYAVFCLKKKKRKEKEEVRRGGGGGGGVFFFF